MSAAWHALLAAVPEAGLRHVLVTLDAAGTPISAGDTVLHCVQQGGEMVWTHESVGGRLEADGSFRGTRWRIVQIGPADSEETRVLERRSDEPSPADAEALKALVAELMRRSGSSGSVPES